MKRDMVETAIRGMKNQLYGFQEQLDGLKDQINSFQEQLNDFQKQLNSIEIMFENIQDKFNILVDAISGLGERMTRVEKAIEPLPKIQTEDEAMKILFGVHSKKINNHEVRIGKLEEITS